MNTPSRFPFFPRGNPPQAIEQSGQPRRRNSAAALLTFLGCVGYAPSVGLGIVVGAGVGLMLYLLPPVCRRRAARTPPK
jgi:hypothetical protein